MTVHHHPPDQLLAMFAAGTADLGQQIGIATHLVGCAKCRAVVRTMEHVGGAMLAGLSPTAMSDGALEAMERRLDETSLTSIPERRRGQAFRDVPGLPDFLDSYPDSPWRWIAPKVHLRPIRLPEPSATRVFLLKSSPGTRMIEHTHTGFEMTCVLSGSFVHAGGHFGPGDFDFGDGSVDHDVRINSTEDCICLVAMQGDLKLNGMIGRLLQPLIRM
ncbi:ChrR family anti-sigma-E factor [Bradyrhizobium quebecense]|uniref:Cupin domain-containing protein n=2 Tax=cellular organisms TaxID=131567 RepID=A0A973WMT1_9BRAD|nr:ChrR family anti-sigma-E factor [Bradyrhizobium quebecense]UGA46775.1 ChrR family anti-sigma-E factor [Bradyrhizobium quebecense]